MKRLIFPLAVSALIVSCTSANNGPLPRVKASPEMEKAFSAYLQAVADSAQDLHSIMVLQHGKVLEEKMFVPDTAHILNSVSKTFTSTAVGFAISEGLLSLDDKLVDLFPDQVTAIVGRPGFRSVERSLSGPQKLYPNERFSPNPDMSHQWKPIWNGPATVLRPNSNPTAMAVGRCRTRFRKACEFWSTAVLAVR